MAAPVSKGYGGSIDQFEVPLWARALGGLDYAVRDEASWKVTQVPAAARTVSVPVGEGAGKGIGDTTDEAYSIPLPNPAAGQRYHVVCARRTKVGASGATTFGYVGDATPATAGSTDPWAAIAARRTFETGDKTVDEQPLALVRVAYNEPDVKEVIDLRCWQANGGAVGASDYVRGYLNRPGTQVMIGTDLWSRVVLADGNPGWQRTPLLRPVNLLAAGASIAGGAVPAGAPVYMQAGTFTATTDASGAARLVFPAPFPNGLLTVQLSPGDAGVERSVAGDILSFVPAGGSDGIGDRVSVKYLALRSRGTSPVLATGGLAHRVNWLAVGW